MENVKVEYPHNYGGFTVDVLYQGPNPGKIFLLVGAFFVVNQIYRVSLKSDYCSITHRVVPFECHCVFKQGDGGNKTR
jgi:hypothetical protein